MRAIRILSLTVMVFTWCGVIDHFSIRESGRIAGDVAVGTLAAVILYFQIPRGRTARRDRRQRLI
jgi:hypothetical protein